MEHKPSLVGTAPADVLIHGPKKLYVNNYHWHSPNVGVVASYTPRAIDVEDHYGVFRGVDQIESFGQATNASCSAYLETIKQNCTFDHLKKTLTPLFISIGQVHFRGYLLEGETFICMGHITFYKFRQMICDGRIYKVPKGLDLDEYFKNYTEEKMRNYELSEGFKLVAELFDVTGKGVKTEKYKI